MDRFLDWAARKDFLTLQLWLLIPNVIFSTLLTLALAKGWIG